MSRNGVHRSGHVPKRPAPRAQNSGDTSWIAMSPISYTRVYRSVRQMYYLLHSTLMLDIVVPTFPLYSVLVVQCVRSYYRGQLILSHVHIILPSFFGWLADVASLYNIYMIELRHLDVYHAWDVHFSPCTPLVHAHLVGDCTTCHQGVTDSASMHVPKQIL